MPWEGWGRRAGPRVMGKRCKQCNYPAWKGAGGEAGGAASPLHCNQTCRAASPGTRQDHWAGTLAITATILWTTHGTERE